MKNGKRRDWGMSVLVFSTLGAWVAASLISLCVHIGSGQWFSVALEGVAFMAIVSVAVLLLTGAKRSLNGPK